MDQSREFMETKIQKMETNIMKEINNEWKMTIDTMIEKQAKRNRGIIKEIITTCNGFRSEIQQEFVTLRGEEEEN